MAKNKKKKDKVEKVTIKADAKVDKRSAKATSKSLILESKATLALAKAQKRKWLVILIIVAIGAFYAIKSGGINFGGIIDKVKGFMP